MGSTSITVCFVVLFLAVFATTGYAFPQQEQVNLTDEVQSHKDTFVDELSAESSHDPADDATGEPSVHHYRAKRFSCDVLSGLRVGNAACKAKCFLTGKRGGQCNEMRQCICRKKGE